MHILHISSPKTWRGGEQQIAWLMEELRAKNIEQTLLCPEGSVMQQYALNNDFSAHFFKKTISIDPFVARKLKQICINEGVDLIHIHDSHAHTFAWLAARFFGLKIPLVISRRVDFPIKQKTSTLWKYQHAQVAKIICVSEKVKEIVSLAVQDKDKLIVVYDGIDLQRFSKEEKGILRKEFQLNSKTILIGNVAAIAPHKDYATFVNAAELIIKKGINAHFFIIGADDGEGDKIKQLIADKCLQNQISLTGFRKDISDILPELDVFLFTSKTEGLGTSVLDALSAAVPVVATRAGGIPEYLTHQENALLANPQDATRLSENVLSLLKNKNEKERIIKNGLKSVEKFSKENMAQKTLAVYKGILSKST